VLFEPHLPFRFEKTLSNTSRVEASLRLRSVFAAVRVLSGVSRQTPAAASRCSNARPQMPLSATTTSAGLPVSRSASGSYSFSFAGTIV
jgi:hypothetical protein